MLDFVLHMIKSNTIDSFNGVEIFLSHIGHSVNDVDEWDAWEKEQLPFFIPFYEALFGAYQDLDEAKLEEAGLSSNQIDQFKTLRLGTWSRQDLFPLLQAICHEESVDSVRKLLGSDEAFSMSHPETEIMEAHKRNPSIFGSDQVAEGAARIVSRHRVNTIRQCVGFTTSDQAQQMIKEFKQLHPDRDPTEVISFG